MGQSFPKAKAFYVKSSSGPIGIKSHSRPIGIKSHSRPIEFQSDIVYNIASAKAKHLVDHNEGDDDSVPITLNLQLPRRNETISSPQVEIVVACCQTRGQTISRSSLDVSRSSPTQYLYQIQQVWTWVDSVIANILPPPPTIKLFGVFQNILEHSTHTTPPLLPNKTIPNHTVPNHT